MKALVRNKIKQCLVLGHIQKVQQAGSAQQQTFYPDLSTGELVFGVKKTVWANRGASFPLVWWTAKCNLQ